MQKFVLETVIPMLQAVGDLWVSGKLQIFQEHFLSEQLIRFLNTEIAIMQKSSGQPLLLLATLPGEEHTLGLLMQAAMLSSLTSLWHFTALTRCPDLSDHISLPWPLGGHKTIQNIRVLEAAFRRAGVTDVSSHNLRKTFATRLLSRGAAISDVLHLLCHASVKTTEKAYAAFVKNERFKKTINLLDKPVVPKLKIVR